MEQNKELIKLAKEAGIISKKNFRKRIIKFQKQMAMLPDAICRTSFAEHDEIDYINGANLEHEFGEGTYVRKISMPKNLLYVTVIHKVKHPFFVMKGKATIISDNGVQTIEAPYHGMTEPGTQRILYVHEDCVWITVHPTDKTTVEEAVEDVIARDYNDPKLKLE